MGKGKQGNPIHAFYDDMDGAISDKTLAPNEAGEKEQDGLRLASFECLEWAKSGQMDTTLRMTVIGPIRTLRRGDAQI